MARILVIRISSFGDVAMLVPVIYSVAAQYPQARLTVLTRKAFTPIFENLGFNVSVISYDVSNKHKGIRGLMKMCLRLGRMGISHVADEHDVLRSKVMRTFLRASGKKVARIDKGRIDKERIIQTKRTNPPLIHTTERYMNVFKELGFPAEMSFTNLFYFSPRNFEYVEQIVGSKNTQWVGIAPFAKHVGKIYPTHKMEKVIEKLASNLNLTLMLLGGTSDEEKAILQKWSNRHSNVIDLTGKLNLNNEILLISYLDVMVSMDSANMHLASLVEVPVVSIWGATHPSLGFYGYGQDLENAVQIDLDCRPCSTFGDAPCMRNDYACLNNLPEEMVVDKIYKVLEVKNKT